jgi:hypothetical protein
MIYSFYVLKWSLDRTEGRTTGYDKHSETSRSPYWTFVKWPLDHAEGRTTGYGKHPGASRSLYWNLSISTTNWILGNFKAWDKRVCLCGTKGTHLSKVPSWAKHLAKDFTTQNKGAPAKTCPTSRKASLNEDKNTYISGEQEQLIELSSFSICSIVQTSQII